MRDISIVSNIGNYDIIKLIDLDGRIMRAENIGSLNEYCMNIAELNSGMYILQIKNSKDTYRKLIIIY